MTAPLQRKNLSCLQTKVKNKSPFNTLHWCCDERPCSETALYTEWTSAQLSVQSQHSVNPSHSPEKMHNMPYIAFAYMICMITFTTTSTTKEIGESVLFQPLLMTYPTCHSWIITAHISLGHLECHWKYFNIQLDKTCQLLLFLSHQPAAATHLLSPLQVELTTINNMYNSCRPNIISAIHLLNTEPSLDGHIYSKTHHRRSLLLFLGDTLRWLTGTATTKDVNSIDGCVNQLIDTQSAQQETLVHIVSILNVTRYAAQVNRHSINILRDMDETSQDVNNVYNLTTSLATSP